MSSMTSSTEQGTVINSSSQMSRRRKASQWSWGQGSESRRGRGRHQGSQYGVGWGWWPRLGYWVGHAWDEKGRDQRGKSRPMATKARSGQAGGTAEARHGCLTQQWELAGVQMPSPGKEGRMTPGGEAMPRPSQGRKSKGNK